MSGFRFRPHQRLRRRRDIRRLLDEGRSVADQRLVVHGVANGLEWTRMAVSVSKRHGPAVRRNRLKRIIREAFRLSQHELPVGYDLLVVARRADIGDMHTCRQSLLKLVPKVADKLRRRK